MERIANPDNNKFRCFEMDQEEYQELTESYTGLCTACGAERDCTEPDAERYECDECEKHAVYGTEQLLLMGRIRFE